MNESDLIEFELLQGEFWPARSHRILRGWIIKEDNGVTWRANSVFPYGDMRSEEVEDCIDQVIKFYNERGHAAAFKITTACKPPDLDSRLDQRGFQKRMLTHVQTFNLNREKYVLDFDFDLEIHPNVPKEWLDKQRVDTRYQGEGLRILEGLLKRIPGKKGFVLVRDDVELIAVGLGVVHRNWLALFSIRVDAQERRKGVGRLVSKSLINWGIESKAKNAFLQVETDNSPALALYKDIGFETAYTYWYRILPIRQR